MKDCALCSIPMALNQTNQIDEDDKDDDVNFSYRECVGSIMYAAIATERTDEIMVNSHPSKGLKNKESAA